MTNRTEEIRARFEAWWANTRYRGLYRLSREPNGDYLFVDVSLTWQGYLAASLESVPLGEHREAIEKAYAEGWNEADIGGGEAYFCVENDYAGSKAKARLDALEVKS